MFVLRIATKFGITLFDNFKNNFFNDYFKLSFWNYDFFVGNLIFKKKKKLEMIFLYF